MRLVQISDSHLFETPDGALLNLNTAQSFAAVLDHVAAASPAPDMIILSGDISQDCSAASYRQAAQYCARFSCPTYWLPGNHDIPDIMQNAFATTQLKDDKAIIWGNWLLILLNSYYPKHAEGYLSRSELSRLEYYLSQYPDQHTLIFLHHPPVSVDSPWLDKSRLRNANDLFAITDRYHQIRGMLCGHVHHVFETHRQGVSILSAPSTCLQFLPNSEQFALDTINPGYRWLDLYEDGSFKTGIERVVDFNYSVDFSAKGY